MRDADGGTEWVFSAAADDLPTMEHAERLFLERTLKATGEFETKLERRNGLWQLYWRQR